MFAGIEKIQLITMVGSIVFLAVILELIRVKLIKEAYALLWLIFSFLFIFFSCWKSGLDYFSALAGIYYPPALLFLLLILAIILVLVQFSVVVSSHNDKIKNLAQEIALLRNELEQKNNKSMANALGQTTDSNHEKPSD